MEYKRLTLRKKNEIIDEIDAERLIDIEEDDVRDFIEVRDSGDFRNSGFFLSAEYDWVLGKDNEGLMVLVPLK